MANSIKILFIGDVIGRPGRKAVSALLPSLKDRFDPELVIANGENAAAGFGITPDTAGEIFDAGVDVITSGNHIWDRKEITPYLDTSKRLLRPANYPADSPGSGETVFTTRTGFLVGVMNVSGRVFMDSIDCPFKKSDEVVERLMKETPIIFADIHCETTSEKYALGWHLDGRASAVVGTHTHVQTSDERLLTEGTAYITDAGMTGPVDSVIGMDKVNILKKFKTQMPVRFEVASGKVELQGVVVTIDADTGRAKGIERIKESVKGSK